MCRIIRITWELKNDQKLTVLYRNGFKNGIDVNAYKLIKHQSDSSSWKLNYNISTQFLNGIVFQIFQTEFVP